MKITNGMTNQMVLKEIGTRLRKYRLDMNMKQSELSKKTGVSLATIRRLESGEDVGLSKLVSILLALGLSSNLDFIIPEEIVNPIDLSSLGHSRKRASKKEKKREILHGGNKIWRRQQMFTCGEDISEVFHKMKPVPQYRLTERPLRQYEK